jgi:hypothetical protein
MKTQSCFWKKSGEMKRSLFLIWTLIFLLLLSSTSNASIKLIPSIDNPQDAVDVAVLIPEVGLGLAMVNYDPDKATANFAIVKDREILSYEARSNVMVGEDLELISGCLTAVIETTQSSITVAVSCKRPYVVVVANSIDYNLSTGFLDFLKGKGVEIVRSTPLDFEEYKDAKTIVMLGGPDAPEGMGEIARQVLAAAEQEFLRTAGNRGMFIHDNLWHPETEKSIAVLAGSDRYETQLAALENKERFLV